MTLRTIPIVALVLVLFGPASLRALAADERTEALLAGSRRVERDGWIYVKLIGTPERLGFQHGYLLAAEVADLLRVTGPFLEHTTHRDWAFYRNAAETMLWKGVDPEYRREIDGIVAGLVAKGVKADRWDLVALNAIEELPYYYVPWLDKKEGKTPVSHAPGNCSAFVATGRATRDGKIVMGHNAWTNYVVGSRWNVIFDLVPERGARLLMDGLPGVIVSDDDFAINSYGLMVTETTITQFEGWDPDGKPEFSRARKAMQYGRNIDDFVRILLDGNNGGYANDWLLGDTGTGEVARFELGLRNHSVERTKDGSFVGSNFPVGTKLIAEETKFDPNDRASSPNARRTRWEQLMGDANGKIDVGLAEKLELDTFDVIDRKEGANDRTIFGAVEAVARGVKEWDWGPYYPGGTVTAKVADATMAARMELRANFGRPVGAPFRAEAFLKERPEYVWMKDLLKDLDAHPWGQFTIDMK